MWEISHTDDAWAVFRARLTLKSMRREMIRGLVFDDVALWRRDEGDDRTESEAIAAAEARWKQAAHGELVEEVLKRVRDHLACAVGGHAFYIDRTGWVEVSVEDLTPSEKRYCDPDLIPP